LFLECIQSPSLLKIFCLLLFVCYLSYAVWIHSASSWEKDSKGQQNNNDALSWEARMMKILYDYSIFINISKTVAYGILIVSDEHTRSKYVQQANALRCYANRHGYVFHILEPRHFIVCRSIGNFFFGKQCAVLMYLIENSQLGWILVLDGDILIVNATKRIEDFIPVSDTINIIHYERFYNGEIAAGNYLIRNHYWSHIYLLKWISLYEHLPKVDYHNNDNGALHLHFLLILNKSLERIRKCFALWEQSHNETIYDQYVGCVKCAIGGKRQFGHIFLFRRGHGFARDYREPENVVLGNDFLIHSCKNNTEQYYSQQVTVNSCTRNWQPPVYKHLFLRNMTIEKELIRYHDRLAATLHPLSVGIPDIQNCWPTCENELNGTSEKKLLQAICR
jgi:hypothetical protein